MIEIYIRVHNSNELLDAQNNSGWKEPQEVILPSLALKAGSGMLFQSVILIHIWKDLLSAVRLKTHQKQVFAFSQQNVTLLEHK